MADKIILLVEDSADDVELTQMAFQQQNIMNKLVVARDGQEALDWLFGEGEHAGRDASEVPTVILLDLRLPKLDGIDVLKRIRQDERTKLLPVVIMTSSKEEQDVLKSYELGVNSYIRKPVDFEQFSEAVKNLGLYWLLLNEAPPKRS
jgi:two-component system response regulator